MSRVVNNIHGFDPDSDLDQNLILVFILLISLPYQPSSEGHVIATIVVDRALNLFWYDTAT